MKKFLITLLLLYSTYILSGADYCRVVPFILRAEGGYFKSEDTYKGVMYNPTWIKYFGYTRGRFLQMEENDWGYIFAHEFWEPMRGYDIEDQKVAESLADWAYNSGVTQVAKTTDRILGLPVDGKFDDATIKAINEAKAGWLWGEINKERIKFYIYLGDSKPEKYKKFVTGWNSRVINLLVFQYHAPEMCE